jgi:hypothetical protein
VRGGIEHLPDDGLDQRDDELGSVLEVAHDLGDRLVEDGLQGAADHVVDDAVDHGAARDRVDRGGEQGAGLPTRQLVLEAPTGDEVVDALLDAAAHRCHERRRGDPPIGGDRGGSTTRRTRPRRHARGLGDGDGADDEVARRATVGSRVAAERRWAGRRSAAAGCW